MVLALLATAALVSGSPESRLAMLQATAPFHIYVMPDSWELRQVNVVSADASGNPTDVKFVYEMSQQTLSVDEAARTGDASSDQTLGPDALYVNGYAATYLLTGPYYRKEGHLTWRPAGVNVVLSSTDLWDVPALVIAALSMR